MNRLFFALIVLLISFSQACNSGELVDDNTDLYKDTLNNNNEIDTRIIKELTVKWNDFLVRQNIEALSTLYAEQVSLYGTSISKELVISNKKDFFKKYPEFNQSIIGDLDIIKVTELQYKVLFPKRSSFNGKTSDVIGYLLFEKVADSWKITNESDEITDKNITKVNENKVFKSCIDVVIEILETSPKYIAKTDGLYERVVKNGGVSFGVSVEGSPNPAEDNAMKFSNTYDFSLHETYTDRIMSIARFRFDPMKRLLYEYDIINDEYNMIEFDRELLLDFNKICN